MTNAKLTQASILTPQTTLKHADSDSKKQNKNSKLRLTQFGHTVQLLCSITAMKHVGFVRPKKSEICILGNFQNYKIQTVRSAIPKRVRYHHVIAF